MEVLDVADGEADFVRRPSFEELVCQRNKIGGAGFAALVGDALPHFARSFRKILAYESPGPADGLALCGG